MIHYLSIRDKVNNNYFNSVNHHIFITPYLALENIQNETVKQTTKLLNIENLWVNDKDIYELEHNKVNAKVFLTEWDSMSKETDILASISIPINSDTSLNNI